MDPIREYCGENGFITLPDYHALVKGEIPLLIVLAPTIRCVCLCLITRLLILASVRRLLLADRHPTLFNIHNMTFTVV